MQQELANTKSSHQSMILITFDRICLPPLQHRHGMVRLLLLSTRSNLLHHLRTTDKI
jgi:hypothetical protein